MEGKLQLKINSKQCCVFGKCLNCRARAQPPSGFAFLFGFVLDRIFLFQAACKGRLNPLQEGWCGARLAVDLPLPE